MVLTGKGDLEVIPADAGGTDFAMNGGADHGTLDARVKGEHGSEGLLGGISDAHTLAHQEDCVKTGQKSHHNIAVPSTHASTDIVVDIASSSRNGGITDSPGDLKGATIRRGACHKRVIGIERDHPDGIMICSAVEMR